MDPFRSAATGSWKKKTSAASLTVSTAGDVALPAGLKAALTSIDVSSTAAATLTITIDSVVVIDLDFAAAFVYSKTFPPGEYTCIDDGTIVIAVSAGTYKISAAGYFRP
jgi:hypothetical protein